MPPFLSTRVEPRLLKWIRRDRDRRQTDLEKGIFCAGQLRILARFPPFFHCYGWRGGRGHVAESSDIHLFFWLPSLCRHCRAPMGRLPPSCFLPPLPPANRGRRRRRRRRKVITIIRATCGVMTSLESDGLHFHLPDPLVRSQATRPFWC